MFFYDSKLRNLIVKSIYYTVTFQKRKKRVTRYKLVRAYPKFYKYNAEEFRVEKIKKEYFTIPNDIKSEKIYYRLGPKAQFQGDARVKAFVEAKTKA